MDDRSNMYAAKTIILFLSGVILGALSVWIWLNERSIGEYMLCKGSIIVLLIGLFWSVGGVFVWRGGELHWNRVRLIMTIFGVIAAIIMAVRFVSSPNTELDLLSQISLGLWMAGVYVWLGVMYLHQILDSRKN